MSAQNKFERERDALWYRQGQMFTKGVIAELFIILTFVLIASAADFVWTTPDDCDASFWHRCGMRVLTDRKTGVQYLETRGGGIIERKARP